LKGVAIAGPGLGGSPVAQLLTINNQPAIPSNKADENNPARIQAITNTAAFHFAFIEQGGSSLYTTLLQQVLSVEALRIVSSIGGTEVNHSSIWHDNVGDAPASPNNVTDPVSALTFPDLSSNTDELKQPNLILPEPSTFISSSLPNVSIIRPSSTRNSGAVVAVNALTADNLFVGQPTKVLPDADAARCRGGRRPARGDLLVSNAHPSEGGKAARRQELRVPAAPNSRSPNPAAQQQPSAPGLS
jgi:hypothetical protein